MCRHDSRGWTRSRASNGYSTKLCRRGLASGQWLHSREPLEERQDRDHLVTPTGRNLKALENQVRERASSSDLLDGGRSRRFARHPACARLTDMSGSPCSKLGSAGERLRDDHLRRAQRCGLGDDEPAEVLERSTSRCSAS